MTKRIFSAALDAPNPQAGDRMKVPLYLLTNRPELFQDTLNLLKAKEYETKSAASLSGLMDLCRRHPCRAVFLDLTTAVVTNRSLKLFCYQFPSIALFTVSERRFHPELQDAMRHCIDACLRYPIDPEELLIVLKGIHFSDGGGMIPKGVTSGDRPHDKSTPDGQTVRCRSDDRQQPVEAIP